jgi:RNA polymerase sigma-70 factor (ECF subfamily)
MLSNGPMTDGHELDTSKLGDHIDRLYRAAWSMCGSREDADDLVQETFALVLRRKRWIRESDIGYLLTAMRHAYIGSLRTGERRPTTAPLPDDLNVADDRVFASPEGHLEASELYREVANLPEKFRDAVIAVDVVGLSYREAAKALKVREGTITTRVHRGRSQLAEKLRVS